MAKQGGQRSGRPSWYRRFLRGLDTSVTGNAQAFGFSVTVTVSFGAVSEIAGRPSLGQMMAFAMAAVAAFSVLNVVSTALRQPHPGSEPSRVVLLATATDFLSVAAAVSAAIGVAFLLPGWGAWLLAPFCAGLVYVLVQAVEMMAGEAGTEQQQ